MRNIPIVKMSCAAAEADAGLPDSQFSAVFGKSFILDGESGVFPRHPNGPMRRETDGTAQPLPLATGRHIVLAPEDPLSRVAIASETSPLMLFDGRNKAQNGWFVVRTLVPSNRTENAVVWHIRPNLVAGWTRPPVVAYNQVGYTPDRAKVAVLELDPLYDASFNTTGSDLSDEETKAAVELLIATRGGNVYRKRLKELLPVVQSRFGNLGWMAARAIPFMDPEYKGSLASMLRSYKARLDEDLSKNPYGVPISTGTWGGAGAASGLAIQMYFLHKAFPEIVGSEYTLRGFDYVLGVHPASNVSYVSSVGTRSMLIAYGSNRADYAFIPGGMVPGIVIVRPDFPELKDSWPFLWFENEYVVSAVAGFILAANAVDALTR